jgi:hypothetical protein
MVVRRQYVLSVVSVVLGVVGIGSAAWFYHAAAKKRVLTYAVSSERARIVSAAHSDIDGLAVSYKGRPVDARDISSAIVYVWNAGNESIRSENVLVPVAIELGSGAQVLDARLVRNPRERVTDFRFLRWNYRSRAVGLGWRILEPGDGAAIQVMYSGTPYCRVALSGAIEGQRSIHRTAPSAFARASGSARAVVTSALLALGCGVIWLANRLHQWMRGEPFVAVTDSTLFGSTLLVTLISLVALYLMTRSGPPSQLLP